MRTKQVNKSDNKSEDGEVIHRGISQRQFARSFSIADDVKVNGAELKDGLLIVSCERILPDHKKKDLLKFNKYKPSCEFSHKFKIILVVSIYIHPLDAKLSIILFLFISNFRSQNIPYFFIYINILFPFIFIIFCRIS